MNFWIIAVVMLVISAAAFCWPLLAGSAKDRITGVLILLAVPVAGLGLYQVIGTPEAINMPVASPQQAGQQAHMSDEDNIDMLLAQLNKRLAENPNNPDGWLILGRTLKTQQRFAEAQEALERANRILPGTPLIMVELAEAQLFASGSPEFTEDIKQLLEETLAIDPQQQKSLWLLGMAAAEEGDTDTAVSHWQALLALLEPGSAPAQSVSEQIATVQGAMGGAAMPPAAAVSQGGKTAPAEPAPMVESGIPVTVTVADDLAGAFTGSATLFVFVHPVGGAGMPLAVKRLAARGFPMNLSFTDADMLQPGVSLQDFEQLDFSARISLAGNVVPTSGDIQANRATLDTKAVEPIALRLDQLIP